MNHTRNTESRMPVPSTAALDPKTRRRALVYGIAATALIAGVAILVFASIQSLVQTRRTLDHTHAVIQELDSLLINLESVQSGERGYVITGDKAFLGNQAETVKAIIYSIRHLQQLVADEPVQVKTLDTLLALVNDELLFIDRTINALEASGQREAASAIQTGRGEVLMDSVRLTIRTLKGRELSRLAQRKEREQRSLRRAEIAGGLGVLAAISLAVAAILLFRRVLLALAEGRRSAMYAETLLNATGEGIYGLDADGVVSFVNRAMTSILGYQPTEMVGKAAHRLFHHTKPDGTYYPASDCPMLKSGGVGNFDNEIIWRKDGTSIPVEYSINQMVDRSGKAGAVVSFHDITDRQIAHAALREGRDAAEAANQAKSDFLARMSHELRTPLNSVIGFSNVLLRNKSGNLRDQDIDYLERIRKNGVNLLTLINDILDLSKIEAGRMEVELAPTSIPDLVRDVMNQLEPQIQDKGIAVSLIIPPSVATIETDAGKLQQIIINLVANAIKFTDKGEVQVSVQTDQDTSAPIAVTVTDSGIGIPANRIEAIFDAFEQAEKSTTRKYGGTGLGLPICRSLCELLGYELTVTSTEGVGSTFTIDMRPKPALSHGVVEVLPTPEAEAEGADAILRGKLVLIIDDDPDSRTLIAHQVALLGGRSAGAGTGEDALRIAREISPDLITLDLLMPGMTGWDILEAVKADETLRDIGVVIVSSVARERGTGLVGALSVLPKPLNPQSLAQALKKGLGVGRVLVVEDDVDSQYLLASYLYEGGATEVRVVAGANDAIAALDEFLPDLVLLDMIIPQGGGEAFLYGLALRSHPNPPEVIIVTGKELTSLESRNLQIASLSIVKKGSELEQKLKRVLREFAQRRSRTPERPMQNIDGRRRSV